MQCWIAVVPIAEEGASRPAWSTYSYETDDRSKKQITANDILFLRDQSRILAVARVERITADIREKTVPRCPQCGVAKIEFRKKREHPYRCLHGHQFAAPQLTPQTSTVHTAHFEHDCTRIAAHIEPAELRPFELTSSRHVKLKSCDIGGICGYVARRDHTVSPLLKDWLRTRSIGITDRDADTPDIALTGIDEADRPFQAIRMRRGVATFREKLIARYGQRCMISGCTVLALLEACHVSRYQGPQDNHPANGILLRSDLHTLFDLDLIGLNPGDFEIFIHSDLLNSEYEKFAGTRLLLGGEKSIDLRAVRTRWEQFARKL